MAPDAPDATQLLLAHSEGSAQSASELLPIIYGELRAQAARYLQGERPGHTLQPTALVHEAYLSLVDIDRISWQGRTHFFAMAARQMRRVLIDHARAASAQKRGARPRKVTLQEDAALGGEIQWEMLVLDRALEKLAKLNARQARVAELRIFSGMLVREVAPELGVSERTVKQDWRFAKAWLARELELGGE